MKTLKLLRVYKGLTLINLQDMINVHHSILTQYENGKKKPSLAISLKISKFFQVSLDYFVDKNTHFPRNLRLLTLASQFDKIQLSDNRNHIQKTTTAFLTGINTNGFISQLDNLPIALSDNFHTNLKLIREYKELNKTQFGNLLNISTRMVSGYEKHIIPPVAKLKLLANELRISAQCLSTGNRLLFDFRDKYFLQVMLIADHYLLLEEHKMLIHLMEKLLQSSHTSQ